jgi:hypothetical protein
MDPVGAWTTIAVSTAIIVETWLGLQGKVSERVVDVGSAVGGLGVAIGGLLLFDDPGVTSWVLTPPVLALATVAHRRVLFAGEGPLRI